MQAPAIIVIGGSAGAVESVIRLASALPADLPAAVFVCIHFPETATSVLPRLINRAAVPAGGFSAVHPSDGDAIEPGRVYVAPPGCHLLVSRGHVRLTRGPKENGHRPAVDPLFRSAARAYRGRVIGVVLSGNLDDGSAGLLAVRRHHGTTIAQDPDEAVYEGMPRNAIQHGAAEHVLRLAELPPLLDTLARRLAAGAEEDAMPSDEHDPAEQVDREMRAPPGDAPPSPYTCPECGGTLFDVTDEGPLHFRCRVGHAYTAEYLLANQAEALEAALWSGLRALEEHGALARRMAARADAQGNRHSASTFTEQAVDAEHHASIIRIALRGMRGSAQEETENAVAHAADRTTP